MRKSWGVLLAGTLILAQAETALAGATLPGGQPDASIQAGSAIAGRDNNRAVLGVAAVQGVPVAASYQGKSDKLGGSHSSLLLILLLGGLIGGFAAASGGGDHPHSP